MIVKSLFTFHKMSYIPPTKSIAPSIDAILAITKQIQFNVSLDRSPNHYLHNCIFDVKKGDRQFDFHSSATIRLGVDTYSNFQVEKDELVTLSNDSGLTLYTKGQSILINTLRTSEDHKFKIFSGGISSFSTEPDILNKTDLYLRFIIPVGVKQSFKIEDFQRYWFLETLDRKPTKTHFLKLDVQEEIHFYDYSYKESHYLIVDSFCKTSIADFQKKCFCILLTLGFVKGHLIHDECFILSYDTEELLVPKGLVYNSMRASIQTHQPLFTTNYYSIYKDIDYATDEKGMVAKDDPLYPRLNGDLLFFPDSVFSKIAVLCFTSEKFQRSILIFIDSHLSTLETKIPNYYVALEAIAAYVYQLREENNEEKISVAPIKDPKIAEKLIQKISDLATASKIESDLSDEDFSLEIILKNINRLNSPPNADKLKEAFTYIDYQLSNEQKRLLIDRNRYLHGSFLKIVGNDELFRKGFHAALKLETMLAILIFKLGGYSGPVINYAGLWSNITELGQDEDRVLEI